MIDIDFGIRASQKRVREAIAKENATPLARFPKHLLDIIDFAALVGFADGYEDGFRKGSKELP